MKSLSNTKYNDPGKPIKQINFKVKNTGGPISGRTIHYQIEVYKSRIFNS